MKALRDILYQAAKETGENGVFFINSGTDDLFVSYSSLLKKSLSYSGYFKKLNLSPGAIIIIATGKNEETISLFWGAVLYGLVPTILPAPVAYNFTDPSYERLINVYLSLNTPYVFLSNSGYEKRIDRKIGDDRLINVNSINLTGYHAGEIDSKELPELNEESPAYIQFSSGSTGRPKGVVLTHKNIIRNVTDIIRELGIRDRIDSSASWMPLYHDMGLFGLHICPVLSMNNHCLIDTIDFLRKPLLLPDVIERYKTNITASTNFAFTLLNKHFGKDQSKIWDLSSVRKILIGAEPISVEVMDETAAHLLRFRLSRNAIMPVYGLAEACLAVSFTPLDSEPVIKHFDRNWFYKNKSAVEVKEKGEGTITLNACGTWKGFCELKIAGAGDEVMETGRIGKILIKGDNVSGYYLLKGEEKELIGEWLDTGDLGFIYEGNLYICGRMKDIIFANGKNYYANDLEEIILNIEGINPGKGIVTACREEGEDDEVLLFLVGANLKTMAKQFLEAREMILRKTGINLAALVPVKSTDIPKTTSGKIRRYKLRERYLNGDFGENTKSVLPYIHEEEEKKKKEKIPPSTTYEKILHNMWCVQLNKSPEEIGIHDDFLEIGGDSLAAATMLSMLENQYRISLHSSVLADNRTISQLAAYVEKHPGTLEIAGKKKGRFSG